jgi:hypothetical protein
MGVDRDRRVDDVAIAEQLARARAAARRRNQRDGDEKCRRQSQVRRSAPVLPSKEGSAGTTALGASFE